MHSGGEPNRSLNFMSEFTVLPPNEGINILPRRPEWARVAGIDTVIGSETP
jgi:hypothetical protein